MGKLFNDIDRLMNWIAKAGTTFFSWFFWIVYALMLLESISNGRLNEFSGAAQGNVTPFLIITAIWIWGTVRWLKRKGYISRGSRIINRNRRFFPFILTNIIAPIIVSLVVHSLTGSASLTIFSIPILSFLSANIEIG